MLLTYISSNGELTFEGQLVWKNLSIQMKKEMYQWMFLLRYMDRRSISLQRQGQLGTYVPLEGQEAAQVGSAMAVQKQDWIFPTYRDHGVAAVAGVPLDRLLLHWRGYIEGNRYPNHLRVLPSSVPIATHLPHAVGVAWAAKLKQDESVTIAYFGDGATSEGDFHEACNFAGLHRLPVIFFCQNNGYAISVPFHKQSATATVVEKASAYSLTGIQVDGNDVLAVYDVMKQQIEQARSKREPSLIEAVTYRYGGHTTSDDPKKYRNQSEEIAWRKKDPLLRYRLLLTREGLWSDDEEQKWQKICEQKMQQAFEFAQAVKTSSDQLFKHLFAEKESGGEQYARNDNGRSDL